MLQTLITLGACGILSLVITSLIQNSFSFCRNYKKAELSNIVLRNISQNFRRDLLLAQRVTAAPADGVTSTQAEVGLAIEHVDGSLTLYKLEPNRIVRSHISNKNDSELDRDVFELNINWKATFSVQANKAILTIVRSNPINDGPSEVTLLRLESFVRDQKISPLPSKTAAKPSHRQFDLEQQSAISNYTRRDDE